MASKIHALSRALSRDFVTGQATSTSSREEACGGADTTDTEMAGWRRKNGAWLTLLEAVAALGGENYQGSDNQQMWWSEFVQVLCLWRLCLPQGPEFLKV